MRTLGDEALRSLDEYARDFITFAKAIGLAGSEGLPAAPGAAANLAEAIAGDSESVRKENRAAWFAHTVYTRMRARLSRAPVEDLRLDFEDGYGNRPWDEEDRHAAAAAGVLACRTIPVIR